MEQLKEGTQLGPRLQSHLFTYLAIASFIQEEILSFSWADSCLALLFLLQFWGMTFRWPSDLLITHRSFPGLPKQPKEVMTGAEWVCNSVPFSPFFIRGRDSESDRTEKLFSPTAAIQFLFKLQYLRCHTAVPINMPWNVEWAQEYIWFCFYAYNFSHQEFSCYSAPSRLFWLLERWLGLIPAVTCSSPPSFLCS